ncbi:MAG: hypothetical protein QOC81_1025 [Thermoanaerobaculia bacterium]|jgi:hypothetical protein|nr:hypothetical protein [Thermoanaerobaculia bacterium]
MKRTNLAAVSLLASFFATAALAEITAERPISAPVKTAVTSVTTAAVASDGDHFLAAWIDRRDDHPTVYASRIDRDGTVLDPLGILIAPVSSIGVVGVAWNLDSWVVVWPAPNGFFAARISPDGQISVPALLIEGSSLANHDPIAANGNAIVVGTSSGYTVLDHELRRIDSALFGNNPSVYLTGANEFTLLASSASNPASVRLDSTGHFISSRTLPGPAGTPGGSISCHGQSCIRLFANPASQFLNVAPYDPITQTSGTPRDLPIARSDFAEVVAIDAGYLLVTSDNKVQRLDLQGIPSGPMVTQCCGQIIAPGAASNGRDAVVLRLAGTLTLTMMTASSEGLEHTLASSANAQRNPAIATNKNNFLAVWLEDGGVYASRFSLDGTPLDIRNNSLRKLRTPSEPLPSVSIAVDGTSYLFALSTSYDHSFLTQSSRAITTMRIDSNTGGTLASTTICGNDMRIANNGSATLAVWVDCDGSLATTFLDVNGAPASTPIILATSDLSRVAGPFVAKPSVVWNGSVWLVIWEEQTVTVTSGPDSHLVTKGAVIRGTRLSPALTPLDTEPVLLIATAKTSISSSHLASDGHDFLAVWSDATAIHARRISAAGVLSEDRQVATGNVEDLVWDGAAYSVAFTTPDLLDLALLRLRPTGQPIESLLINSAADEKRSATLVSLGGGRVLAAYSRVAHEAIYGGVERAFIAAPRPARGRAARK